MLRWCSLIAICLLMAGCRFLDISDEQVKEIAALAGQSAASVTSAVTTPYAPGAGAGIGAVVGLGIAGLTKIILSALQKKKTTA